MEISIPFKNNEWNFPHWMLHGVKVCTSRTRRYGEVGDRFKQWGAEFEITAVFRATVYQIAQEYYQYEGFTSPGDFLNAWNSIHPHKGNDMNQLVWVHWFKKVSNGG